MAGLDPLENDWKNVHDFNPGTEPNFSFGEPSDLRLPSGLEGVSVDPQKSVVK